MSPYDRPAWPPDLAVPRIDPAEQRERVEAELLRAGGLSSGVPVEDREEPIGHIRMLDYDDIPDVLKAADELGGIPGISVLLKSSGGSYHGYNLSIADLRDHVFYGLRGTSDAGHLRASARRGYFVLRWTAKLYDSGPREGEAYKPAPEIARVWLNDPEGHRQSGPHLKALATRAEEDGNREAAGKLRDALESYETAGDGLMMDYYQTATDQLKGRETADVGPQGEATGTGE